MGCKNVDCIKPVLEAGKGHPEIPILLPDCNNVSRQTVPAKSAGLGFRDVIRGKYIQKPIGSLRNSLLHWL